MTRFTLLLVAALVATAATALAASAPTRPPGGPAPKALIGTWHTTLTPADVAKAPLPSHMPLTRKWFLVILNTGSGTYPRVLGLRPAGEGGPSIPFGVQRNLIHLECLGSNELPIRGQDTFAWSAKAGALRLRLVRAGCRDGDDRNNAVVLTSELWRRSA